MTLRHNAEPSNTASLRTELLLVAFLIGLGVAARYLPHAWNFSPIAASALFAGMMLSRRSLALAVPVGAMLVSTLFQAPDDWRITLTVYAAIAVPALIGIVLQGSRPWLVAVPAALASSLIFFGTTNFAVWAFSGMYSHDGAGLIQCYIAALPFLKYTAAGDVMWTVVLFGGALLVQRLSGRSAPVLASQA